MSDSSIKHPSDARLPSPPRSGLPLVVQLLGRVTWSCPCQPYQCCAAVAARWFVVVNNPSRSTCRVTGWMGQLFNCLLVWMELRSGSPPTQLTLQLFLGWRIETLLTLNRESRDTQPSKETNWSQHTSRSAPTNHITVHSTAKSLGTTGLLVLLIVQPTDLYSSRVVHLFPLPSRFPCTIQLPRLGGSAGCHVDK